MLTKFGKQMASRRDPISMNVPVVHVGKIFNSHDFRTRQDEGGDPEVVVRTTNCGPTPNAKRRKTEPGSPCHPDSPNHGICVFGSPVSSTHARAG